MGSSGGGAASGGDSSGAGERTVIAFDLKRKMVQLDRRLSGASVDADVRAGPWPGGNSSYIKNSSAGAASSSNSTTEVTVHAFVDHAVVSLITGNETAISAWVAPQRADSVGVVVFSELGNGEVTETVDVWQLATPTHDNMAMTVSVNGIAVVDVPLQQQLKSDDVSIMLSRSQHSGVEVDVEEFGAKASP